MMSLLAVFGFLAAVLYEGHSLSCEQCSGYGSTSCKGSMRKCKALTDMCIQGFENKTLDGDVRVASYKRCHNPKTMPPALCDASEHSFRNSHLHLRFVAQCGKKLEELEVPPINLTYNGYECPDCFIEGSVKECTTDKVIKCVGRQTECMNVRGKADWSGLDVRSYSVKGCSTPGACSLMYLLPGTHFLYSTVKAQCTPACNVQTRHGAE
ncbi:phospholipase A2 inhibitor and Ly6/PLAUR domain-containing protein-like [Pleurodeles waltl]